MWQDKKRIGWRGIVVGVLGSSTVAAIVTAFILQPTNFFAGLRAIPGEIRKTTNEVGAWYRDDVAWSGRWTNAPEGYVDAPDMKLSAEDIGMDLNVKNGEIDGTVSTKTICDAMPFKDFLLVRGSVSDRTSATIIVWDTFQGRDANIAELELKRDGVLMTVVPKGGAVRLFPKEARLAIDPSENEQREFCEGKRESVTKALLDIAKHAPTATLPKER